MYHETNWKRYKQGDLYAADAQDLSKIRKDLKGKDAKLKSAVEQEFELGYRNLARQMGASGLRPPRTGGQTPPLRRLVFR
jgi:hypothetical protein